MFLGNIRREMAENDDLRAAFGVKKFIKDAETELIIEFDDGHKARIIARGGAQKIRGTNWLGVRPDLIVCDDLENDEAVLNQDRREKFRDWFMNTLIPSGSKSCTIRVVGTILHEDSLLARLMPNQMEDPNVVIEDLRVWTTTTRSWLGVLYRAHPDFDDFSRLLWPEQWSKERLLEVRQAYIDDGYPEGYAQEYLNDPVAGVGAYFDEEDLLPILPIELDRATMSPEEFYIGVDLAISAKDRSAYTVFAVVGVDPTGMARVREIVRNRFDSLEIIDMFMLLHEKYSFKAASNVPPIFLVEKENISKAIGPVLSREMLETDTFLTIEEMPPIHDKRMRARSFQARTRMHRVEFDHTADWWPALKHELMLFDKGRWSDQVDALAWVGHYLANMSETPTYDDMADEAYEEELEEAEWGWWDAQDQITGY